MEVRIGHRAHELLNRNYAFKEKLIAELTMERFANICFIDEPGTSGFLELKCLGGEEVVVPESSFSNPAAAEHIVSALAMRIK